MVAGKARKGTTIEDILYEMKKENQLLHALLRDRKGFSASETKPIGTSGGTSGAAGPSGFLKTAGDTMIGPIAFFPDLAIIDASDNSINVSKDAQLAFTSRAIVSAISSTTLETIHGASFAGQILMIQGILTETFTIVQTGNIRTFDGGDIEIVDNQNIWLVFDSIANEWAAVGGSGGSGTGTHISADLIANQTTSLAVGNHIEYDRNATPTGIDGGIVLQTGVGQANGIFELLAGKTYFLSAAAAPIKAAATILEMAWYDRTAGNEIGRRAIMDVAGAVNLETLPKAEIIFTPTIDTLVDFRIVANVTPANLTGFFAGYTYAHIFEFSGKNGAAGTPGLDGSPAWKAPVRACAIGNVANLAAFTVLQDGVTLIEGDRVLLTQQTTASENGIYDVGVVAAGLAPLTRSLDLNTSAELIASIFVAVEEGTTKANTLWQLTSNNPMTIGVTAQVWTEFVSSVSAIGPAGSDGTDASGTFILDGRLYAGYDKLSKMQQYWNIRAPTFEQNSMILIESEDYDHGDLLGGGATAATNPAPVLVIVGGNGTAGAGNTTTHSRSINYGESWTPGTSLSGLSVTWDDLCYDPAGKVLLCASNDARVGRSTDKGVIFFQSSPTPQLANLKWIPRLSLFIGVTTGLGTNVIWTTPDGVTWTNRTTPAATPDPPTVLANFDSIVDAPALGKVFCFGTQTTTVLTSTDGITWILETMGDVAGNTSFQFAQTPTHAEWSEGMRQFITFPGGFSAINTVGYFRSPDGLNWTNHVIPTMSNAHDITVLENLSMFIIAGIPINGKRAPLHYSNDGINWIPMPPLHMRNQDYDGTESASSGLLTPRTVVVSNNFNYIFASGMNPRNALDALYYWNRFWRTEVYMNEIGTSVATLKAKASPR